MRLASLLLWVAACSAKLEVPAGAKIGCAGNRDCPTGQLCHPVLKQCLALGADPAQPAVAFVSPRDSESNVSVTPTIVVAFTLDVDGASVSTHAHVTAPDGTAVTLAESSTDTGNTIAFSLGAPLSPLTTYAFTLDAGVAPAATANAISSTASFTSHFTTGAAPDTTPPAGVANVVIDRGTPTRIDMQWVNPGDGDLAGVLVLRKAGAPVTEHPQAGVTYATNTLIGDAEVVALISGASFSDITVAADIAYDYAFFSVDTSSNYSPPVRVPFVSAFALLWCPSQSGTFTVDSPDAGSAQLRVFGGSDFPAAAQALGAAIPLAVNAAFALGQTYTVRSLARNANGIALGVPQPFTVSDKSLGTVGKPVNVSVGGAPSFSFTPFGWQSFDTEVDTNPAPGHESYVAGPALPAGSAGFSAPFLATGTFRYGVRPHVEGCPNGEFITSSEFNVGGDVLLYVSTSGNDTHSGLDPADAVLTLAHASSLAVAANAALGAGATTDIHVSVGTYAEALTLLPNVSLHGGYSADFSARDPSLLTTDIPARDRDASAFQYTTTIHAPTHTLYGVQASDSTIAATTILDGFTVIPDNDLSACGSTCATVGLTITGGAAPIIQNCDIQGGTPSSTSGSAFGVAVQGNANAQLLGNRISHVQSATGSGASVTVSGVGLLIGGCSTSTPCRAVVSGNHIIAHIGIRVNGSNGTIIEKGQSVPLFQPVFDGNLIAGDPDTLSSAAVVGFDCTSAIQTTLTRNAFFPRANSTRFTGGTTVGIRPGPFSLAFVGNFIDGGPGPTQSSAIEVANSTVLAVANVMSAGEGADAAAFNDGSGASSTLVLTNNTIYADRTAGSSRASAIEMGGSGAPNPSGIFVNNLVFGSGAWSFIDEGQQHVLGVAGNVLLAPSPKNTFSSTTIHDTDIASMETDLCADGRQSGGNALVTAQASDVFVSFVAPETLVNGHAATLLDSDWHLRLGSAAVAGGLDASQLSCTIAGNACMGSGIFCGAASVSTNNIGKAPSDVTTRDADSVTRTVPYSAGAYERDP